jgi:hypothetical protein
MDDVRLEEVVGSTGEGDALVAKLRVDARAGHAPARRSMLVGDEVEGDLGIGGRLEEGAPRDVATGLGVVEVGHQRVDERGLVWISASGAERGAPGRGTDRGFDDDHPLGGGSPVEDDRWQIVSGEDARNRGWAWARSFVAHVRAERLVGGDGEHDHGSDAEIRRRILELHEESLQRRLPDAALGDALRLLQGSPDEPLGCLIGSVVEPVPQGLIEVPFAVHAVRPLRVVGLASASMAARSARFA